LADWATAVTLERANYVFDETATGNLVIDQPTGFGEVPIGPLTGSQTAGSEIVWTPATAPTLATTYTVFGNDRPEKHKEFNKHYYVAKKIRMKLVQGAERYFVFKLRPQIISEQACRNSYMPSLDYLFCCFTRGQLGVVNESGTNIANNIGRCDYLVHMEIQRQYTARVASVTPDRPRTHNLIESGFKFGPTDIGTDQVLACDPQTGDIEPGKGDAGNV